jgi:5,8-dihydroxy-2-naphthoate synthase
VKLRVAHSSDLDDAFMFWAVTSGRVDARAYGFDAVECARGDTETLNAWARAGAYDVVAVSVAAWPSLAREWLLLPHGGSVGRGYGPVVVASRAACGARVLDGGGRGGDAGAALAGARVGVPGASTTCAVLVSLFAPRAQRVTVPMTRAFDALDAGEVDACALIHEGRLTYAARGCELVLDLGQAWQSRRGLPLPLGANVIRRALGPDAIARASALLRESIRVALANRERALDELEPVWRGLARAQADAYLALYGNDDTLGYDDDTRRAIDVLLADGAEAGLLARASAEFAP